MLYKKLFCCGKETESWSHCLMYYCSVTKSFSFTSCLQPLFYISISWSSICSGPDSRLKQQRGTSWKPEITKFKATSSMKMETKCRAARAHWLCKWTLGLRQLFPAGIKSLNIPLTSTTAEQRWKTFMVDCNVACIVQTVFSGLGGCEMPQWEVSCTARARGCWSCFSQTRFYPASRMRCTHSTFSSCDCAGMNRHLCWCVRPVLCLCSCHVVRVRVGRSQWTVKRKVLLWLDWNLLELVSAS